MVHTHCRAAKRRLAEASAPRALALGKMGSLQVASRMLTRCWSLYLCPGVSGKTSGFCTLAFQSEDDRYLLWSERGAQQGDVRAPKTKNIDFCRHRRKSVETPQPMRLKAIQGHLSRFRWSRRGQILGHFEPRSLSIFFHNSDLKIRNSELWKLTFRDFELSKKCPETSLLDS